MTHANIFAFETSTISIHANLLNAAKRASAVSAAEAIANHFPIAAVVFPVASNISVLSLTSFGRCAISAIPQALSAIGPNASIASWIPVVAIIPVAANATPYTHAMWNASAIPRARMITGIAVDIIPTLRPEITFVQAQVRECFAMDLTGALC